MERIKLTQDELNEKLKLHRMWLENAEGGERLCGAYDLTGLKLNGASLYRASLNGASLNGASLDCASLNGASLDGASLYRASLNGASLNYASLNGALLNYASLDRATNIPPIPLACPSHGAFTAWKKVGKYIIKLEVPEDAKRSSATTEKCRCDKALVLAIENMDGTDSGLTEITNKNYATCVYRVGETVYPDSFDDNRWDECSHGIHFFIDRISAERY